MQFVKRISVENDSNAWRELSEKGKKRVYSERWMEWRWKYTMLSIDLNMGQKQKNWINEHKLNKWYLVVAMKSTRMQSDTSETKSVQRPTNGTTQFADTYTHTRHRPPNRWTSDTWRCRRQLTNTTEIKKKQIKKREKKPNEKHPKKKKIQTRSKSFARRFFFSASVFRTIYAWNFFLGWNTRTSGTRLAFRPFRLHTRQNVRLFI